MENRVLENTLAELTSISDTVLPSPREGGRERGGWARIAVPVERITGSPFGYCSVAITGIFRMLAASTCGTAISSTISWQSAREEPHHFLCHSDDFGEVANAGAELLLHVAQEEVAGVGAKSAQPSHGHRRL